MCSNICCLGRRQVRDAQLARDRLSAREIADKLYIPETTIRTTLRNVYSKINIHSKTLNTTKLSMNKKMICCILLQQIIFLCFKEQ